MYYSIKKFLSTQRAPYWFNIANFGPVPGFDKTGRKEEEKKQVVFSSDGIETTCSKDDEVEDEDKVMQRVYQNKTQRSTFTLNTKKNDTVDVPSCQQLLPGLSSRMPLPPRWVESGFLST
jgi:hypothetical protein